MKLKIKLKEILLKLDTMLIVFLGVFYVIYVMIAPTDTIPLSRCRVTNSTGEFRKLFLRKKRPLRDLEDP